MTGGDWHDPFAEDPAAVERERRRAEREARRRGRRQSLGEKVAETQAPPTTPDTSESAAVAGAAPVPPPAPSVASAAAAPGAAEREAAPPRPATAERPELAGSTADPGAVGPVVAPPRRRSEGRGTGGRATRSLRIRQLTGVLIIAAVAAGMVFVVAKVIDRFDGPDEAIAPPPVPKTTQVTVPEGLDRHQIAEVARKAGLEGDYLDATKKAPKGFDLAEYGAEDAPNLEGFLFPDTWDDLPKRATVRDLVKRQLDDFRARLEGVDMSYAKSKNLSVYDVVKIASIIEKEIAVPDERPLAAAVIYNRLAANNPLGMDSTIRYYLQNYDEQLTESELSADEPYNTRVRTGLPPTPISNPGLASLEAAAKPAKSDAFYFVIKPGTCNEHTFVATEQEFQQAEAEYQQALQQQGGSPTDC